MIEETITFKFDNEEQQKRFHERLNGEVNLYDELIEALQLSTDRMEVTNASLNFDIVAHNRALLERLKP